MKKILALLLLPLALYACNGGGDTPAPGPALPSGYVYAADNTSLADGVLSGNILFFGTSTVRTLATDELYTDEKALFELVPEETGTLRMLMHETRFAAAMPALEMEVPGIEGSGEKTTLALSAPTVVPEIKGTPFARYTITDLTGKVENTEFSISFTCAGAFEVTYRGRLIVRE